MPRLKRRIRQRAGYSDGHRAVLLDGLTAVFDPTEDASGFALPLTAPQRFPVVDLVATKDAWCELRNTLLPQFIRDNPGRRPWGWHMFDAPSPRRAPEWYFVDLREGFLHRDDPDMLEPEAEYLERIGVLAVEEQDQLAATETT